MLSSLAAVVVGVDSRRRRRHVWVKVVSGGGGRNRLPSGATSCFVVVVGS